MNDNAKAWVEALRSGEFQQAQEVLYDCLKNAYCCLGVACVVYQRTTGIELPLSDNGSWAEDDDNEEILPEQVREWLGVTDSTGHFHATVGTRFSLAELNDEGDTFDTIAALIESEPPGLFVEDA